MKKKPVISMNCEVYKNFIVMVFNDDVRSKTVKIEILGRNSKASTNQIATLRNILINNEIYCYDADLKDIKIAILALKSLTVTQLNCADLNFEIPRSIQCFSLKNVLSFQDISVTQYGARIHISDIRPCFLTRDLDLSDEEITLACKYTVNTLRTISGIFSNIRKKLELRQELSETHGQDLTNKSDAQIAEAVIKSNFVKKKRLADGYEIKATKQLNIAPIYN